jgi:hypothetical protein
MIGRQRQHARQEQRFDYMPKQHRINWRSIMKKAVAAIVIAAGLFPGATGVAHAAPPGPGDPQCTPGQQGNPHPGFKAGAC